MSTSIEPVYLQVTPSRSEIARLCKGLDANVRNPRLRDLSIFSDSGREYFVELYPAFAGEGFGYGERPATFLETLLFLECHPFFPMSHGNLSSTDPDLVKWGEEYVVEKHIVKITCDVTDGRLLVDLVHKDAPPTPYYILAKSIS